MDYVHRRYTDRKLTYGPDYNEINFQHPSILGIYNTNTKGNGRYIVGKNPKLDGVFKKANPNDVAEFDESIQSWVFNKPYKGMELVNIDINDTEYGQKLLRYDGSKWIVIMDMTGGGGGGSFDYAKIAGRLDETHNFSIKGIVNCTPEPFNGTQDVELSCNRLILDSSIYKIDGILSQENGGTGNNYGGASKLSNEENLIIQLGGAISGVAESDLSVGNRNMVINVSRLNADKIDRGTVAVSYGGTGRNIITKGRFIVGDGVNPVTEYMDSVGSNKKPIYVEEGKLLSCDRKLDVDIYGNADSSTKLTMSAGKASIPVFFNSDGKPQACTSIDLPLHAVADSAKKLETPRRINLSGDVEGSVFFDGSQDVTIESDLINSYDASMQWGAGSKKNILVKTTPVDAAINPSLNNLFRRMKDEHLDKGVKIEYSEDKGNTWNPYKNSIENKYNLTNLKTKLELRGTNTTRRSINADRIRISINSAAGEDVSWTGLWCLLKKLHLYIDTNGSVGCKCQIRVKIEDIKSTGNGLVSWINTRWEEIGSFDISGSNEWNSINFNLIDSKTSIIPEFGGSWCPSKTGTTRPVITKLELIFRQSSIEEWTSDMSWSREQFESDKTGLCIYSLYGFGIDYNTDRNADASPIAYKLANPRAFQISGKATADVKMFDGTQDVNLQVTDISANRLDHNVTFKLTGDILGSATTNLDSNECNIVAKISDGLAPVGSLTWFCSKNVPAGYLLCDGRAVSRTTYSALFQFIGTTWGSGDGSTTFNLPNYIGKTVWGGNSGDIGNYKDAGLPNILGELGTIHAQNTGQFDWANGAFRGIKVGSVVVAASGTYYSYVVSGATFNASRSNSIYGNSSTVQPPAACALPCIKY